MSDLVFERAVKIEGVRIAPYTTNGYQLNVWSKLRPFEGTCDIHLLAFDVTDAPDGGTSYVMEQQVTRHYAQVYVLCDTLELKAHWEALLVNAKRVCVELASDYRVRHQANFEHSMHARSRGEDWSWPDCLSTSAQELRDIDTLNYTANSELRKSMENRHFDSFPFLPKNPDGSTDFSQIVFPEAKES